MKKVLIALIAIGLVLGGATVQAAKDNGANDMPQAGLFLYAKDANWAIDWDGAWGKVNYTGKGFVFNGHDLVPGMEYTLIVYTPDEWPAVGLACLGTSMANKGGEVSIKGPTDIEADFSGEKVWLVLADDVDCGDDDNPGYMTGWHPMYYLFEHNLVGG